MCNDLENFQCKSICIFLFPSSQSTDLNQSTESMGFFIRPFERSSQDR